jgi:hypothetical protein
MAAGIITQGLFPGDILPGMQEFFGDEYKQYEPIYSKFFKVTKSEEQFAQRIIMSPFGLAKLKDEGAAFEGDTAKQGYTKFAKQLIYGMTFALSWEAMMYGHALAKSEVLSRASKKSLEVTREVLCHLILNNANTVTGAEPDGVALLSAAHPLTGGGVGANTPSVAAALSEASLEQAWIDIANITDERGKPIQLMDQELIVPFALKFEAERILKGTERFATADRDINAMKNLGILQKPIIASRYLTNSTMFFIKTSADNGLEVIQKVDPTLIADSDPNVLTRNAVFVAYMILVPFYADWRGVYGNPGA